MTNEQMQEIIDLVVEHHEYYREYVNNKGFEGYVTKEDLEESVTTLAENDEIEITEDEVEMIITKSIPLLKEVDKNNHKKLLEV